MPFLFYWQPVNYKSSLKLPVDIMIKRNFFALVIFLVLLFVAGWFYFADRNNTFNRDEAEFALNDTSLVNLILVRDTGVDFKLIKKDGLWQYNSLFDVKPTLMNLCYRIISQVEIKSPVSKALSAEIVKKIKQQGVEIILMNNQKLLRHYYLWDDVSESSIYIMQAGNYKPFLVNLPSFNGNFVKLFRSGTDYWRDLTIIRCYPNQIKSIKVEQTGNQSQSFELKFSENGKISLTGLENKKQYRYKQEAIYAYLLCFRDVKVRKFYKYSDNVLNNLKNRQPDYIITIVNSSGKISIIKIFKKLLEPGPNNAKERYDANFCYILINNHEVALANYIDIDPITRDLNFFIK